MTTTLDSTTKIRELNDRFRTSLSLDGKRLMTVGIQSLPLVDQIAITGKVMTFDTFTEDNDPHGEHDFGSIDHKGERIFWKIDYYDRACKFGSEDPADPAQTTRVLTIMLADEY
jgi:major membrane immunogen (membrane-anchored lipoprotein)